MIALHKGPCDEGQIRASTAGGPALSVRRGRLVLAATVLASGMAFIDGSVVNVALPAIQRELHADAAASAWVMNAYLLTLGAFVLVGGALADRFGRRRSLLAGMAVFTAASIACGLSPGPQFLIAVRAVQGLGAALLTPASLAILGASFREPARGLAIGAWAGFASVAAAVGPVLGGWLVDRISWRAAFFVNVPIAVAAAALALLAVPESRDPDARGLDLPGAGLAAAGLGLLVWGLTEAPSRGFGAPAIAGALVAGAAALAGFAVVQARSPAPMAPPALFRSRDFLGANLLTLCLYFALGGALFFLPFELIRAHGYAAAAAGAALLPFSAVMGLFSTAAGRLGERVGPRGPLTLGPILAAAGLFLLGWRADASSYWTGVLPALLVLAVGMTLAVAPLTDTVMASVGDARAGTASGVNNAVARVAGLLAVAVMSLVFAAGFDGTLDRDRALSAIAPAARPARGQGLSVPLGQGAPALAAAKRAAFQAAYREVMTGSAAAAFAGGLIAFLTIRGRPSRRRS